MTGLAAANLVVQRLGLGQPAEILPGAPRGRAGGGVMHARSGPCLLRLACRAGVEWCTPSTRHRAPPLCAPPPGAVEPDEPHVAAAKELNKGVKSALYGLGLRSPLL